MMGEDVTAFQIVFAVEAIMFIAAALVATGTTMTRPESAKEAMKI